jgi:hypothetical protein
MQYNVCPIFVGHLLTILGVTARRASGLCLSSTPLDTPYRAPMIHAINI